MDSWSTGQREKEQPPVNPIELQRKWIGVELKERSASQEHFLDICRGLAHRYRRVVSHQAFLMFGYCSSVSIPFPP